VTNYSLKDMERAYLLVAPRFHHLHMENHKQMLLAIKAEMRRQRKKTKRQGMRRLSKK
jgi:hypothetical protein